MKPITKNLEAVLKILVWAIFIGLLIQTGAIAYSYILSISQPETAKNLYNGWDMYAERQHNFVYYSFVVWYRQILYITQSYILSLMIKKGIEIRPENDMAV